MNEKELQEFLKMYKPGDIVYPKVIQRNLKLKNMKDVYDFCDKESGLIKMYALTCPACKRILINSLYSRQYEIPEYKECYYCDCEFTQDKDNTSVVYLKK